MRIIHATSPGLFISNFVLIVKALGKNALAELILIAVRVHPLRTGFDILHSGHKKNPKSKTRA